MPEKPVLVLARPEDLVTDEQLDAFIRALTGAAEPSQDEPSQDEP